MGKGHVRRGLLLIIGVCAGFGTFWLLLVNTGLVLAAQRVNKPILHFRTVVAYEKAEISLPCAIAGTPLIAEQIVSYDGPFMEDGSEREVMNVAALRLHNAGCDGIEDAQIIIERGNKQLVFEVDTLPPGATVLVLEKNAAVYTSDACTACYGNAALWQNKWNTEGLEIKEADMGTLEITNIAEDVLENICIYYKSCLTEADLYIGGKTYCLRVSGIKPGRTLLLFPAHYANGYSRIVRISREE